MTESNNSGVPLTAPLGPRLEPIIADLAIEIWRLERRLARLEDQVGSAVLSPLRESLVRMQDRLEVSGIEFRDHDGEEFIDGLLLKVVHVEAAADRLFVSETLQPTVVLNDQVIAHGHVVLSGRPEDNTEGASANGRETIDFGIDLGTSNSSIAVVHDQRVEIIRNNDNDDLTLSVVRYLQSGTVQVGRAASQHLRVPGAEASTFSRFKRQMGQQEPFDVGSTGSSATPEMLAAEVLKSLRQDGETWAGEAIRAAVITVPAMFELAQCEATQRAAAMAGIVQAPLLQEPIAAGLAYGYDRQDEDGYFLVYDIGAGTFDATLMRILDGRLTVVSADGDNYLGGSDWDLLLSDLIIERLADQGYAFWDNDDPDGFELRTKMKVYAEEEKKG